MSWFDFRRWSIEDVAPPWGGRPSILRFIETAPTGGPTPRSEIELPDEDTPPGRMRWAAGAKDGVFTHHMSGGSVDGAEAAALWSAVAAVLADADRFGALYGQAREAWVGGTADALVAKAKAVRRIDRGRLRRVARRLVREGADREPVKLGIVLLGVVGDGNDRPSLERLARHEEFTLYAFLALGKLERLSWLDLMAIAKDVHGWGRVHVVERLSDCKDPLVMRWLVRDGFRNSVMDEYLALLCAEGGDLAGELAEDSADDELLDGAADLLSALVGTTSGGPSTGFEGYARGVDAVRGFLRHASRRAGSLSELLAADRLRGFVESAAADWPALVVHGWTEAVRAEVAGAARAVKALPDWPERVIAALASADAQTFHRASEAAEELGMDVWEAQFQRIRRAADVAEESWWFVVRTDDRSRMSRVVVLAEERLALDAIASRTETSPHPHGSKAHQCLGVVLQELRRFPTLGWTLMRTGIRGSVAWPRNMALAALETWDRGAWPQDVRSVLDAALREETAEETRATIERLLRGPQRR